MTTFTEAELLALCGKDDTRCRKCTKPLITRKDVARHMVETDIDQKDPCPRIANGKPCWCSDLCWSEFYCTKYFTPQLAEFALHLLKEKR